MRKITREYNSIARNDYPCNALECLQDHDIASFDYSDRRALVEVRRNGWKIKKGQKHLVQFNCFDGRVCKFRAIPEVHAICIKYDAYDC